MHPSNGCRTVLLLLPPVLFLFPVAALTSILERVSKNIFYNHLSRNIRNGDYEISLPWPGISNEIQVALDVNNGPILAILGVCIIAYAVAVVSVAGIWQLKKVEGTARHERVWVWIVLVCNLIMVGASLAGFGYATSVQASDGQIISDGKVPDREFTRETWACQIDKEFPSKGWAGQACSTTQAMRYLLLPMAVAALCVLGSLWVLVRSRGGVKWVFGGKGRYGGFQGAYELQPQGLVDQYAGPPGVQWVQQPTQQWTMQPGQQWVPQPYQQWGQQPVQQWGPQPVQQWGPQPVAQAPKSGANVEQRPIFQ
ncbi:uncharacterized protein yc1106_06078 [Curvularia clavata]|uniref:Uncharacterized protein n=1 Tax=Curvularia clavata TaxID=95742 RepID=A0A9Q9DUH4_CURCL|nr:uncharacterized protein yc1106_06078 [Curvularia clavata]